MEETLLDALSSNSSCELTLQYRMNEEIMKLSNALVYNGKLTSGTETVGSATLDCGQVQVRPEGFMVFSV